MERKTNMVGWFEIPSTNIDRAIKFYEEVFDVKLTKAPMGDLEMAFFSGDPDKSGAFGAIVKHDQYYKPSHDGVLIYFMSEDITTELSRVEKAGGKVLQPKTLIAENVGHMAMFEDTEGNRIALHSRS
jgi:uncharacterized protein